MSSKPVKGSKIHLRINGKEIPGVTSVEVANRLMAEATEPVPKLQVTWPIKRVTKKHRREK